MNLLKVVAALVLLALVLWAAYRIGQVVLRILAGLLFIALFSAAIWYFFLRLR